MNQIHNFILLQFPNQIHLSEAWTRNTAGYDWKFETGLKSMIRIRIKLLRIRIFRNNLSLQGRWLLGCLQWLQYPHPGALQNSQSFTVQWRRFILPGELKISVHIILQKDVRCLTRAQCCLTRVHWCLTRVQCCLTGHGASWPTSSDAWPASSAAWPAFSNVNVIACN